MADPIKDAFVPMVDEHGRVTGIMDRMTADYLASTDPNPTQAALDAVLSRATRARLLASRIDENRRFQFDVVRLDVSAPADLAELREALRIVENPEGFGHLMSLEDERLELSDDREVIATLAILRWSRLRWAGVRKHDGVLADFRAFADWLFTRGVPDAREEWKASEDPG